MTENEIQIEAVRRLERLFVLRWPSHVVTYKNGHTIAPVYAVPNDGKRPGKSGAIAKAKGLRSGVPDICVPVPSGGFHGLYIEIKTDSGVVSPNQRIWLAWLRDHGYAAKVCRGVDEVVGAVLTYMEAL